MKISLRVALVVAAIWLACSEMGIGRAQEGASPLAPPMPDGRNLRFESLTMDDDLSEGRVWGITQDSRGVMWFAIWDGVNRYDGYEFKVYKQETAKADDPGGSSFWPVYADQAGMIWAGSHTGDGLSRFDPTIQRWAVYRHDEDDFQSLSSDNVYIIFEDSPGVLWIGTEGGGLNRLECETEDGQARFGRYQHDPADAGSLEAGIIHDIYQDHAITLWVGTSSGGLCRCHRDTETFTCYEHDSQDAGCLSDNAVWAIHEDRDGLLWVGTSGGLNRLDPQTGDLVHYTTADGLPRNTVFGSLEEGVPSSGAQGYLWLSTFCGLSCFDPQTGTLHNYGARDGLQGDAFDNGAYHKASTGELFFGGPQGLTVFHPDDIQENPHILLAHITGIQLANAPVLVGGDSLLKNSILDAKELALSYTDRIISFQFAALDFSSPHKNRYRYRLEGLDEDWHELGSDLRLATYTNLDPGRYTFRVLDSNNDGVWNQEGTALAFTLTLPWWSPWWFRGLLTVLMGGLVFGTYCSRVNSIEHQSQELECEVEAATRDLNERIKQLNCLYGISRLAGRPDISLEEILQGTVELIPPALQYSEIACARIVLDDQEFKTSNHDQSRWQQKARIVVHSQPAGRVEVGYLGEKPEQDYVPFSAEEIELLNAIAERLGRIAERKRAESSLASAHQRLETLQEVSYDLGTTADPSSVLNRALQHLRRVVGFQRAAVMLVDEGGDLVTHSFYAPDWSTGPTTVQIPVTRVPVVQRALDQRQPIYFPDLTAGEGTREAFGQVTDELWSEILADMKTWLGVQLVVRDRVLGLLSLLHDEPDFYDAPDRNLVRAFASPLAIAIENARLYSQAQRAAAAEERTRLARELHDSVTQSLYSITLHTDATLLALSAGKTGVVKQRLERLNERARDAMTEMRLLVYQLRPSILEETGLAAALNARLQAVEARSGLKTDLQVVGERRLPREVEAELFWVALEGLNNALKHAQASEIRLQLVLDDEIVRLVVQDNGIGFEVDSTVYLSGYGLTTMEERMEQLGGGLEIDSAPGSGTTLRAEVKA